MDIMLDRNGDLLLTEQGDIVLAESTAQKINIRLRWLEGEWRWNKEEGLPYFEHLFRKKPDIDFMEAAIRRKIFEIPEVTSVKDVRVTTDSNTRKGIVRYTALTDQETIRGELNVQCLLTE